jgi:outer membrane protein TolC
MADPIFDQDPLIRKVDNSIDMLNLENRLQREQFKPQLDLKYNTLLNLADRGSDPSFSLNDYKYGVTFMMPILNRKTKGEVRLNEAMIDQNNLDRRHYLATLETKYNALLDVYEVQSEQLITIEEKIQNSTLLYEAEVLKFGIGESSIFLLNQRERKILEANIDLISTTWKLGNLINELYYLKLGQG